MSLHVDDAVYPLNEFLQPGKNHRVHSSGVIQNDIIKPTKYIFQNPKVLYIYLGKT